MTSATAPSLLLIGGEPYITRACMELGVELVVVYASAVKDGDGLDVPDTVRTVFVQDQRTPEAVLSSLHRAGLADGPGGRGYDAVLTFNEHALVHAAVLARLLGCRGMDPGLAVRFRDKWLQKKVIRDAGIPTARSTVIEDIAYPSEIPELDSWPRVLKPIHGVGTQLTALVSDMTELRQAAARFYRRQPRYRVYVAEEFISHGDEWTADGVVFNGEIRFLSVATYPEPCLSVLQKQAALTYRRFDPEADAAVFGAAAPFARRCVEALGMTDGIFHMELFHDPATGELIFGECNGRRGAALVPEEIRYKFNVDLGEEAVRCALGLTPRLDVKVCPDSIGNTYLLGPPGLLVSSPSPAQVLAREGARYVTLELPVGSVIPDSITDMNTCVGMAVLAAPSPDALYRRMDELRTWFASQLVVAPPDASVRTLRAWHRGVWPDVDLDDADYIRTRSRSAAAEPAGPGERG
jgi:biotin carboxylase